jgi:hypothetical protein
MPCGFWWNWWVQVAVAVGTISAAIVALVVAISGDRLKHRWFPPKLKLTLLDPEGTHAVLGNGTIGRWYHVLVHNEARWSNANQVRVLLLQVEEPAPNGALQITWTGAAQLIWENQSLYPAARTVGADARADLLAVLEAGVLQLQLAIIPFNLKFQREEPCRLTLTLQARGDEGDSEPLRVTVSWDGKWDSGAKEMRQHLILEPAK